MDIILSVLERNPVLLISMVTVFGLLIGSFLNVVIYRVPVMMNRGWKKECQAYLELPVDAELDPESKGYKKFNLMTPNSTCGSCDQPIKAWNNIPVISWLVLRGKCGHCKAPYSVRYPIVEAVTGILAGLVAWKFGFDAMMLAWLLFTFYMISLTMIDADTMLLPDSMTLPLMWVGILLAVFSISSVSLNDAVIGAVAGYMSLWSVNALFQLLRNKQGMGAGDFKLFAVFGAWFGWQALPLLILLASFVGAVIGIIMMLQGKGNKFPFGPYLAGAAMIYVFFGTELYQGYLNYLGV